MAQRNLKVVWEIKYKTISRHLQSGCWPSRSLVAACHRRLWGRNIDEKWCSSSTGQMKTFWRMACDNWGRRARFPQAVVVNLGIIWRRQKRNCFLVKECLLIHVVKLTKANICVTKLKNKNSQVTQNGLEENKVCFRKCYIFDRYKSWNKTWKTQFF